MSRSICKLGVAFLLIGIVLAPGWSQEDPKPKDPKETKARVRLVQDEAKLFSKETIAEVNAIVAKIRAKHKKDLFIETVLNGPERDKAAEWAQERFNEHKIDGVYIVITKKPGIFRIVVGKATLKELFTKDNVRHLETILTTKEKGDLLIKRAAEYTLETMSAAADPKEKEKKD
jgi:uncharacterized membrane protein YgcG